MIFHNLFRFYLTFITFPLLFFSCQQNQNQQQEVVKESPAPPNLILIMADDLGFETVGAYGGESYQTPRLDRMASEGMLFENCYSTPLCTPSRVQIMTGKYNFRNYVAFGMLDDQQTTFGHLLQDAGYATCIVGKWQLYGNDRQREMFGRVGTMPEKAGFGDYCLWQLDERGRRYKSPLLKKKTAEYKTYENEYGPDIFLDYAQNFISENKDKPFFLYYPMCLVHDPFQYTPDTPGYENFDPEENLNDTTYFDDMMAYMDKSVGSIIDQVEAEGLAENTLILFIGDNGTHRTVYSKLNGEWVRGNKGYTDEMGTHVPFLAYWKGRIKPGTRSTNLIDFTDFLPTLMEAAQTPLPQDFLTDGNSFLGQLTGSAFEPREWVFCHYAPRWGNFPERRWVHDKNWKLYETGEWYNLQEDQKEEVPLAEEAVPAETAQTFKAVLAKYRK